MHACVNQPLNTTLRLCWNLHQPGRVIDIVKHVYASLDASQAGTQRCASLQRLTPASTLAKLSQNEGLKWQEGGFWGGGGDPGDRIAL